VCRTKVKNKFFNTCLSCVTPIVFVPTTDKHLLDTDQNSVEAKENIFFFASCPMYVA
jgi:hypothetical protein